MRPERVFGANFHFANTQNAVAFAAEAKKITEPYSRFVTIWQKENRVRVEFLVDSLGVGIYEALNAELQAVASTFA